MDPPVSPRLSLPPFIPFLSPRHSRPPYHLLPICIFICIFALLDARHELTSRTKSSSESRRISNRIYSRQEPVSIALIGSTAPCTGISKSSRIRTTTITTTLISPHNKHHALTTAKTKLSNHNCSRSNSSKDPSRRKFLIPPICTKMEAHQKFPRMNRRFQEIKSMIISERRKQINLFTRSLVLEFPFHATS